MTQNEEQPDLVQRGLMRLWCERCGHFRRFKKNKNNEWVCEKCGQVIDD